jgi:hypothetical protein
MGMLGEECGERLADVALVELDDIAVALPRDFEHDVRHLGGVRRALAMERQQGDGAVVADPVDGKPVGTVVGMDSRDPGPGVALPGGAAVGGGHVAVLSAVAWTGTAITW